MTPNEKDYMDRYIYQVIHRLPKAQREEVRMELEELISDMYADRGSMEEVLTELGDPAEFAKQYQNGIRHIRGAEPHSGPAYIEAPAPVRSRPPPQPAYPHPRRDKKK